MNSYNEVVISCRSLTNSKWITKDRHGYSSASSSSLRAIVPGGSAVISESDIPKGRPTLELKSLAKHGVSANWPYMEGATPYRFIIYTVHQSRLTRSRSRAVVRDLAVEC